MNALGRKSIVLRNYNPNEGKFDSRYERLESP